MVVIGYLRLHQRIRSQIFSGILEMENLVLGGIMTEHMYSESGAYAITASFWNADCGLITITTEFYVEGCGDVMPEGCYDDNGTFYLIGEELFVAECEFYFCEGGNNWSALQEIPGCGNDCEFEIVATQQDGPKWL